MDLTFNKSASPNYFIKYTYTHIQAHKHSVTDIDAHTDTDR